MAKELPKNLRNIALKLISYKEYTEKGLQSRLCKLSNFESEEDLKERILKILNEFKKKGWLSDKRAVDSLLNQKSERYGINRINMELKRIGAPREIIDEALESLRDTEYSRAKLILEKKFHNPPSTYEEGCKQKNYLQRRGFSFKICSEIVDKRKNP